MNAKTIATISVIAAIIGVTVASLFFRDNDVMFMAATALVTFSASVAMAVALVIAKRNRGSR